MHTYKTCINCICTHADSISLVQTKVSSLGLGLKETYISFYLASLSYLLLIFTL